MKNINAIYDQKRSNKMHIPERKRNLRTMEVRHDEVSAANEKNQTKATRESSRSEVKGSS